MNFSLFDLFKIGIGPSSSHTVAPMVASNKFVTHLREQGQLHQVETVSIELYGSLALTGKRHGIDVACVMGLIGKKPDIIDPEEIPFLTEQIKTRQELPLNNERFIHFDWKEAIKYHNDTKLFEHSSGMRFTARGSHQEVLHRRTFFSIGDGFIVSKGETDAFESNITPPYLFSNAAELLTLCEAENISIAEIVFVNELAYAKHRDPNATMKQIYQKIDTIWKTMAASIDRGTIQEGELPGKLKLKRRAKDLQDSIVKRTTDGLDIDSDDWVNLFAMAVSEENAAGGRVVAAPSNGAAGVIPAVLAYYNNFVSPNNTNNIRIFLATAAGIGSIYKSNASISTQGLGCQGEIGVACSMAAAGLAAAKGGTPTQIENAAEIGMEHNLGLTCDPMNGLVQIPCIERNTMGAVKAINAVRLALRGDPTLHATLDSVIKTMHEIGHDMTSKYKKASDDGISKNTIPINVVEC